MVAGICFYEAVIAVLFLPSVTQYPLEMVLSLALCVAAAFLSAFLDALLHRRCGGDQRRRRFYGICTIVASSRGEENDMLDGSHIDPHYKTVLERIRSSCAV